MTTKHESAISYPPSNGRPPARSYLFNASISKFLSFKKKLRDLFSFKNKLDFSNLMKPDLVWGTEDRELVESPAYQVPFRHICFLRSDFGGGITREGTGWLAGPRLLVTSAHVVHRTGQSASKPLSVTIIPALDGDGHEPYDRFTVSTDAIHLPVNDPVEGSPDDYAVIVIPSTPTAGWFGLKMLSDSVKTVDDVNVSGYPEIVTLNSAEHKMRQFRCTGSVTCEDRFLKYKIDTTEGQSGSPVWINEGGKIGMVVGIHVQATADGNRAIRITPQVYDFINKFQR